MARLGFARPFPSLSPPRGPFSSPRARFLFLSLNLAGRSVALTLPLINITTFITLADNDDHSQWELRAEETYRRAGTNSLSLSLRHLFSPSPLRASLSLSLSGARASMNYGAAGFSLFTCRSLLRFLFDVKTKTN